MANQPQAGAQPLAVPHQAPQPAVGADGAEAAVPQLQAQNAQLQAQIAALHAQMAQLVLKAQINSLQLQVFRVAVVHHMAEVNIVNDEYPTTRSVIREQKSQQVIRFREVYLALPNSIKGGLLGKYQQQVTRYINSKPWEIEYQESL